MLTWRSWDGHRACAEHRRLVRHLHQQHHRTFTELKKRGGSAEARDGQRLIIGPWDHLNSTGVYPDRKFGLTADALFADLTGAHQRFFDRWLRGRADAWPGPP
ncbi:MAG TPA: hypothetical protein VGD68_15630, partial [Streptosporangiaceae bacterium]